MTTLLVVTLIGLVGYACRPRTIALHRLETALDRYAELERARERSRMRRGY